MTETIDELELKYDGPVPAEERAEAEAGGKPALALMRARGVLHHWNRQIKEDIRNLRVVRKRGTGTSVARAERSLAYYRRHRHEALRHLIRLQRQERLAALRARIDQDRRRYEREMHAAITDPMRRTVSLDSFSADRAVEAAYPTADAEEDLPRWPRPRKEGG